MRKVTIIGAILGLLIALVASPGDGKKPDYSVAESEFTRKKSIDIDWARGAVVKEEERFVIVRLLKNEREGKWSLYRVFKTGACMYPKGEEIIFRVVRYERGFSHSDNAWFADCRRG